MMGRSFTFTHALCRSPAPSVVHGLRADDRGNPDPDVFAREHAGYVEALRAAGAEVIVLQQQDAFPDSVFIEDPALVLNGVAILLRPGAPSRTGEAAALRPALKANVGHVVDLPPGGYVDGGDILCSDSEVMVGLSARTDAAGAEALRPLVEDLGYRLRVLDTPAEILHFKTDSALLDAETILSTARLAATGCFDGYRVIEVPEGEEAAANAMRFNAHVFLADGFPATADRLTNAGYSVRALPVTQAALVDGGLSCMSLRYTRG